MDVRTIKMMIGPSIQIAVWSTQIAATAKSNATRTSILLKEENILIAFYLFLDVHPRLPEILRHACNRHCDHSSYHPDTGCRAPHNRMHRSIYSHVGRSNDTIRGYSYILNGRRIGQCPWHTHRCPGSLVGDIHESGIESNSHRSGFPHSLRGTGRIWSQVLGFRIQLTGHKVDPSRTDFKGGKD